MRNDLRAVVLLIGLTGFICHPAFGDSHDANGRGSSGDQLSSVEFEWVYTIIPGATNFGMKDLYSSGFCYDRSGNVFITGSWEGQLDFGGPVGVLSTPTGEGFRCFLAKLDSAGSLQWVKVWVEGTAPMYVAGIVASPEGDIYVADSWTGLVSKFSPAGKRQWRASVDLPTRINASPDGGIFVLNADGELFRVYPSGYVTAILCLGPGESGRGFGFGPDGSIYFTGDVEENVDRDAPSCVGRERPEPDSCAFLSNYSLSGELVWERTWRKLDETSTPQPSSQGKLQGKGLPCIYAEMLPRSSPMGPRGANLALDKEGNIYVVGSYGGTVDFDPGPGSAIHGMSVADPSPYDSDFFLSKFDSDGEFKWVRVWGNEGWEREPSIGTDALGHVYVAGTFSETLDFDPGPGETFRSVSPGQSRIWIEDRPCGDVFLSHFDSNGNFRWVETWGSPGYDTGEISIDPSGMIFLFGDFMETVDFDPGPGVENRTAAEMGSLYLMKLNPRTQ